MNLLKNYNSENGTKRWMASVVFAVLNVAALVMFVWILKTGFEPLVGHAATGIYKALNFRGTLKNSDSTAVADGAYNFYFSIYDAATGTNCLYTARGTCGTPTAKSITVTSGVFSTLIGDTDNSDNPITIDFNSTTYWLGVKVGTDAELTPRVRIGAAGYAFNADLLDGLHASTNGGTGSYVPATNSSGGLTLTGVPQTSFVSSSTFYINPASATANYPLFGAAVGGVEMFRVDASGNMMASGTIYSAGSGTSTFAYGATFATSGGNIGIGTLTPGQKLEVSGVGRFVNPDGSGFSIGSDGGYNRMQISQYSGGINAFSTLSLISSYLGLRTKEISVGATFGDTNPPLNGMIVEGKVGIGTTAPSSTLEVLSSNDWFGIGNGTATTTIRGSGTSTFANGIQLTSGCYLMPDGTCAGAAVTGANQALSNLSTVAINTSLLPGTENSINLGSYAKTWKDVYASGTIYGSIATSTWYGSIATSTFYGSLATSTWYASVATTTLDGVTIGGSTAATGTFTGLRANETANFYGIVNIGDGGDAVVVNSNTWHISSAGVITGAQFSTSTFDGVNIGASTPGTGAFTSLSANLFTGSLATSTWYGSIATSTFYGSLATSTWYGSIATSTFPNITVTNLATLNLASSTLLSAYNGIYVGGTSTSTFVTGARGIATSTFYSDLSIVSRDLVMGGAANTGWLYVGDGTATTSIRGGQAGSVTSTFAGDVSIPNLSSGMIEFTEDGGVVPAMNIPVATATTGTVEGYTFDVDGLSTLFVGGTSDGLASVWGRGVGINTTAVSSSLAVNGVVEIGNNSSTTTIYGNTTSTFMNGLNVATSGGTLAVNNTPVCLANGVNCAATSTAAGWTKSGTEVYLPTGTDHVTVGASGSLAKLTVLGDGDVKQFVVKAASTQNANMFEIQNNSNGLLAYISPSGNFGTSGTIYASGNGTSTFSYGVNLAVSGGNVVIGNSQGSDELSKFKVVGSAAIGSQQTNATGTNAFAAGNTSNAGGSAAIALGHQDDATGAYALALGINAKGRGEGSIAMGPIIVNGNYSMGIGLGNNASNGTIFGDNIFSIMESTRLAKVGINTTAPSSTLAVVGASPVIEIGTGSATTTIYGNTTSTFVNGMQIASGCYLMPDGTCAGAAVTGANQALSNLSAVAINLSLTPGSPNSIDLGSYANTWRDIYASGTIYGGAGSYTIADTTSTFSGSLYVGNTDPAIGAPKGSFYAAKNVYLGDGTSPLTINSDTIDITGGTIYGARGIVPEGTSSYSLGGSSNYWSDLYVATINSGAGGLTSTGNISAYNVTATNQLIFNMANQATERLCHTGSDGGLSQSVSPVDCNGSPGDIAEYYGSFDTTVGAGDVVRISDFQNEKPWVEKTTSTYSDTLGVVSTAPYDEFGKIYSTSTEYSVPVALIGRVPVKVSNENGPIAVGDYLTSASLPGYAMKMTKPGVTIGQALSAFDGSAVTSTVTVFMGVGYYDSEKFVAYNENRDLTVQNDLSNIGPILAKNGIDMASSTIFNVASISGAKWAIDADGNFATAGEIVKTIATSQGEKKFYPAYNSDPTIMLTGSGELVNGEARIIFDPALSEIFDPAVPIKTAVTLTSEGAQGLYVAEKSIGDILVKEINGGKGGARFDYIIVATRKMSGGENPPSSPFAKGGQEGDLAQAMSTTSSSSDPNFPNSLTPSAATSTTNSAVAASASFTPEIPASIASATSTATVATHPGDTATSSTPVSMGDSSIFGDTISTSTSASST